jgi:pyruvate/2-oxoglutarate/acetoin dehydrogenase E1 component
MQFNDFVATGFNQLVNNAAKIRYRWGGGVPMVVRMPWGGLRHAGPYHSQTPSRGSYRTPGLKIVVPSTPEDARALMAAAVADPDPVCITSTSRSIAIHASSRCCLLMRRHRCDRQGRATDVRSVTSR